MSRRLADSLFHAIKSATRDLVSACGGGKRAATIAGISEQTISRYQRPDFDDLIPVAAVLLLEAECGLAPVTAAMAAHTGRTLGDGKHAAEHTACLVQRQSDVMRETSDVMARFAEVVSDGQITPAEADAVRRELGDLMAAADRMASDLAAIKAAGGRSVFKGGKR